ncbi:hypothetical protein OP10G_1233 [Fimbriimonas ginsengisoli Gsoil 348]|uniref:Uncharacterized protein n=1 Tax=Fimbriimonas ginsengisoli Gsoil 348 TaxID=661478 RepID=A0A068NMC7_FIMGI|nr:hypothetical protein OP10G_1233 [Fimbriimonas ginsengisoli Gsoil 348]
MVVVALTMAIAMGLVFVVRRRTLPGWIGCQSVPSRQARVSACVVSRPFKEYRKEILDWVERERFQIDNLTDVAIFTSRGKTRSSCGMGESRTTPEPR